MIIPREDFLSNLEVPVETEVTRKKIIPDQSSGKQRN